MGPGLNRLKPVFLSIILVDNRLVRGTNIRWQIIITRLDSNESHNSSKLVSLFVVELVTSPCLHFSWCLLSLSTQICIAPGRSSIDLSIHLSSIYCLSNYPPIIYVSTSHTALIWCLIQCLFSFKPHRKLLDAKFKQIQLISNLQILWVKDWAKPGLAAWRNVSVDFSSLIELKVGQPVE